jgi:cell division septation protein DedD
MITIRPSTVTEDGSLPPKVVGDAPDTKKPIPIASIPATIIIGLLIAAIYLGGRIVAARRPGSPATHRSNVVAQAQPAQLPAAQLPAVPPPTAQPLTVQPETVQPPAVQLPATLPTVETEVKPQPAPGTAEPLLPSESPADSIPMITPRSGERYIQVGALGKQATERFIQRLRDEKLEPHVAPGPTPELMRVLIGPFDDREALNAKRAQLQAEGIDTYVREY